MEFILGNVITLFQIVWNNRYIRGFIRGLFCIEFILSNVVTLFQIVWNNIYIGGLCCMEFILGNVVVLFQIVWNQIYRRIMLYRIYLRYCCGVIS